MMSNKEAVMKLWNAKCNLSKTRLDIEDVANTLKNWQFERMDKGLKADPGELADSVTLFWYANVLQLAQDAITRIHETLETDMILNEV